MRRVFIADAHLRNPEDDNYRLLIQFLRELRGTIKTLYILGDLFEFWIGYRKSVFPHYTPILDCLRELADAGAEIVYFEGNHDFHLGSYFAEVIKATVYPGPATLNIDGHTVYLCHGDQINNKDIGYLTLRFLLHNNLTKALFPQLPPWLVFSLATYLSGRSKKNHKRRNVRWNYKSIITEFAKNRFEEGCDAVVTAHFHLPFIINECTVKSKTVLSLGDWITQYTYGELLDGKLVLRHYKSENMPK
jgi:UDP-2,3-diacylglucosamine hydrolase